MKKAVELTSSSERRVCIERRRFFYSAHIPERRNSRERRFVAQGLSHTKRRQLE